METSSLIGWVAGQSQMDDGATASLLRLRKLTTGQGELQVWVDRCEGEQFGPVGNSSAQQVQQDACECGVALGRWRQCDLVSRSCGQNVGACNVGLQIDGFRITGGQGTTAEVTVEDDHLLDGATLSHRFSELLIGQRGKR